MKNNKKYEYLSSTLCNYIHDFHLKSWVPASSGNFSARLNAQQILITESGIHKGRLTKENLITINYDGLPINPDKKSSAETGLHLQLYKLDQNIAAIFHSHSINSSYLTTICKDSYIKFSGYEILKAFHRIASHEEEIIVPIFENDQDINRLSSKVNEYLIKNPETVFYMIRKHGIYTWGQSLDESYNHLEAAEYLIELKVLELK
jgi:methylthioribulose-1-phosphate dehydratase